MLNVPSEIQAVIKNDATLKNFRVHFPNGERSDITNENIVFESVSFTESVCSNDTFKFGLAEASVIEFETVGVENIVGLTIECSMEFKVPSNLVETYGEWYSIPYGVFIIDKCPRNHEDMTHRKVVGYSTLLSKITTDSNFENLKSTIFSKANSYQPVSWRFMSAITQDNSNLFDKDVLTLSNFPSTGNLSVIYISDENPSSYFSVNFDFRITNKKHAFVDEYVESLDYSDLCYFNCEFEKDLYNDVIDSFEKIKKIIAEGFEGYHVANQSNLSALVSLIDKTILKVNPSITYTQDYNRDGVVSSKTIYFDPLLFAENNGIYTSQLFYPYRNNAGFREVSIQFPYEFNVSFTIGLDQYEDIVFDTFFLDNVFLKTLEKANKTSLDNLTLLFTPTLQTIIESTNVYSFVNAYKVSDIIASWAELNCAFVHSERDGSISVEKLNNSNPYQLELSDIEESVWWDEYDVSPIGTIRYTFLNPLTGQVGNGEYVANSEAKSIYDLSGNKFLESIDFSIYKAATVAKMTNKNLFYLYTGSESGYTKNNFYFYNGTSWVSGGVYNNATSIVEFVLDNFFVPNMNYVNFTPVEMDLRGLPFLEAGDAITLTAQDGTVLNSYILNHTIDGIQHLTQSVESVSGEVIK